MTSRGDQSGVWDAMSQTRATMIPAIPAAESDFLLRLPDLYHEIGHPLIATTNNRRTTADSN